MLCSGRRQRPTVCCCFPWPHISPRSEKPCLPPKTIIQIKLNEVTVANPCVFQLLKHSPLTHERVGQARCIWPPVHRPCSQAARLPVPGGGNSRPLFDFLPHCSSVCAHLRTNMCACTVIFSCAVPLSDSHSVYSLLLVLPVRLCTHVCVLQETFIFVCDWLTRLTHISCFCWGLDNLFI